MRAFVRACRVLAYSEVAIYGESWGGGAPWTPRHYPALFIVYYSGGGGEPCTVNSITMFIISVAQSEKYF